MSDIINQVKQGKFRNIIVLVGAGLSVESGIPDFRTLGTGFYGNLASNYGFSNPEDLFDRRVFIRNPMPFYQEAHKLLPEGHSPNDGHKLLAKLVSAYDVKRVYTQNIDGLEQKAGIDPSKLVLAHGSFDTAHCSGCQAEADPKLLKEHLANKIVLRCENCKNPVKPGITFFGEKLSQRYKELSMEDFENCELLMVIGTSLKVEPFRSLVIHYVKPETPRILINLEDVQLPFDIKWAKHIKESASVALKLFE